MMTGMAEISAFICTGTCHRRDSDGKWLLPFVYGFTVNREEDIKITFCPEWNGKEMKKKCKTISKYLEIAKRRTRPIWCFKTAFHIFNLVEVFLGICLKAPHVRMFCLLSFCGFAFSPSLSLSIAATRLLVWQVKTSERKKNFDWKLIEIVWKMSIVISLKLFEVSNYVRPNLIVHLCDWAIVMKRSMWAELIRNGFIKILALKNWNVFG